MHPALEIAWFIASKNPLVSTKRHITCVFERERKYVACINIENNHENLSVSGIFSDFILIQTYDGKRFPTFEIVDEDCHVIDLYPYKNWGPIFRREPNIKSAREHFEKQAFIERCREFQRSTTDASSIAFSNLESIDRHRTDKIT